MKYPKTIIDECSGTEVPNELYKAYQDGQISVVEWVNDHSIYEMWMKGNPCGWEKQQKEWGL